MIRYYKGAMPRQGRLGIFPGAYNPPTTAHLAVAEAAWKQHSLDQVVFLLPRTFPHKSYAEVSIEDRLAMLLAATAETSEFAVASSEGGLFFEIAREFRASCGPAAELLFLSGRDAAERIVGWNYAEGPSFKEQLGEFQLLVASRRGGYAIPAAFKGRILTVEPPAGFDEISSSAARAAIAEGSPWRQWVPKAVADEIVSRGLYRR